MPLEPASAPHGHPSMPLEPAGARIDRSSLLGGRSNPLGFVDVLRLARLRLNARIGRLIRARLRCDDRLRRSQNYPSATPTKIRRCFALVGNFDGNSIGIISLKALGNHFASFWFNHFSILSLEKPKPNISMISGFLNPSLFIASNIPKYFKCLRIMATFL